MAFKGGWETHLETKGWQGDKLNEKGSNEDTNEHTTARYNKEWSVRVWTGVAMAKGLCCCALTEGSEGCGHSNWRSNRQRSIKIRATKSNNTSMKTLWREGQDTSNIGGDRMKLPSWPSKEDERPLGDQRMTRRQIQWKRLKWRHKVTHNCDI